METIEVIENFIKISSGSGSGSSFGDGSGDGSGFGSSFGSGYGSGLKLLNNQTVYLIDNVQTIIISIKKNIAKGFIVNTDLTLTPCYIAKNDNLFAHGKTIKEAYNALQDKIFNNLSDDERINAFVAKFLNINEKIKAIDLFDWHNKLTGSCKMGREQFCKDKGIDINFDNFTIVEFIKLTENSYGRDIILKLKEKLGII